MDVAGHRAGQIGLSTKGHSIKAGFNVRQITGRIIDKLLNSNEPSIRYKIRVNVLNEDPASNGIKTLQEEIRHSARVKKLLANRDKSGQIVSARNIYDKWQGAHWILATLADIGYPSNDESLLLVGNKILDFWLADSFYKEYEAKSKSDVYNKKNIGVPIMEGRYRRCASQQGYALFFLLKMGIVDERVHQLVERLLHWQWPDGGWNCDKNPYAAKSSFIHTTWTLRGLGLYSTIYQNKEVTKAVKKAADVLLRRKLYKRVSNDQVIKEEFTLLHYPLYWHYDILGGLKVLAESGLIMDARCNDALDLLESKLIAEEGWPAEKSYYRVSDKIKLHNDYVDWGGTSKKRMNEWITVDALYVLKESGRLKR